jgi:hypothetical protein
MRNADSVVPTMANIKIAPKFRKKYFWKVNRKGILRVIVIEVLSLCMELGESIFF